MTHSLYSEKQLREADRLIREITIADAIRERIIDVVVYGTLIGGALLIAALIASPVHGEVIHKKVEYGPGGVQYIITEREPRQHSGDHGPAKIIQIERGGNVGGRPPCRAVPCEGRR
jgi:hypothetical protein